MNRIFVRSDFPEQHAFRLVSMDDAWVKRHCEHSHATPPETRLSTRKRKRDEEAHADTSIVFVMKGDDQLCLHDQTSTRSVRRVEYSNVLMLAERRLNATGKAVLNDVKSTMQKAAPLPPTRLRECHDDVVVASLTRMFDSHAANPQLNVLTVLAGSYLSIEELEAEAEERDGGEESLDDGVAPHSRHRATSRCFTFAELARQLRSSPAELADVLQRIGAVVHRGHVRLLQPSLVYEALGAVLTYFDAADAAAMSWAAVRTHLCPAIYPAVVLRSLEAVYGAPSPPVPNDSGDDGVCVSGMAGVLDVSRVLTGLAGGIFETHDAVTRRTLNSGETVRGLPLDEFLKAWWDSIPLSLFGTADVPTRHDAKAAELFLEKLRGCAVLEPRAGMSSSSGGTGLQGMLWWLPKEALTDNFAARLRVLFELRPQKWDQQDLKAYMDVLLAPDQNFQHVMVRYAREYRIPGQVVQYAPLT
ncbi:Sister chromatid cohesion protein Dcc1 [Lotmaria passim]